MVREDTPSSGRRLATCSPGRRTAMNGHLALWSVSFRAATAVVRQRFTARTRDQWVRFWPFSEDTYSIGYFPATLRLSGSYEPGLDRLILADSRSLSLNIRW